MDKLLFKRILVAAMTVLALVYAVYLLFSANFSMLPIENAVETTITDKIFSNAVIIRDENYILNRSDGVLSFSVDDGDAVKAGGEIAKIYSTASDAAAQTKIESLEKQLSSLESLQKSFNTSGMGIETINSQIYNNIISYIDDTNRRNITAANDNASNLLYSINQMQAYTGKISSFSTEIAQLKNEINQLKASSGKSKGLITTPKAGYFLSYCDGYEKAFDYDNIDKLTLDDIKDIKKSNVPDDTAGKVISGSNWYIACKVTADEARSLELWDSNVTVLFADASTEHVKASIYKIIQKNKKSDALLILKCNYMSTDLAETRNEPIEIGLGTYSGLRISKKAIHDDYIEKNIYDDNGNKTVEKKKVQGVYVLHGSEVQFKQISILYAGNDFVICDTDPEDGVLFVDETISLYDQVILEGDDLYDGKIIK